MIQPRPAWQLVVATLVVGVAACGDGGTELPANRAPLAVGTIPPQSLHVGDSVTLDVAAYFTDPDGDTLIYAAATSNPATATAAANGSRVAVAALTQGSATVTVTATDPDGLAATQGFEVTVPNRGPLPVDSIPDLQLVKGDSVTFDVADYFSDPDGDNLAYTVATSDAATATAASDGSSVTVAAITQGSATISVTATDPGGLSATQSFGVTVHRPPFVVNFATPAVSVPEGDTVVLEVVASTPPDTFLTVRYSLGADGDPATEDADEADYAIGTGNSIEFAPGATTATLRIGIVDDSDIEPAREVLIAALDPPGPDAEYQLGSPGTATITIDEGVCDRTAGVQDGIMHELEVSSCTDVDGRQLTGIPYLRLCFDPDEPRCPLARPLDALIPGDFQGLTGLRTLNLFDNNLSSLPPDIFLGLEGLTQLWLSGNGLDSLGTGVLAGLARLEQLYLNNNQLAELTPGTFSGLPSLRRLLLGHNRLDSLAGDVFAGLLQLEELYLHENRLSELPAGVFSGLSALRSVSLYGNPGVPFTLTLELRRTDNEDLSAPSPGKVGFRIDEGAPFDIRVPLSALGGTLSADTVLVEAGDTLSAEVVVTRAPDGQAGTVVSLTAPTISSRDFRFAVTDPILLFPPIGNIAALSTRAASSPEGRSPTIEVVLTPPPTSPFTLVYELGVDDDTTTVDADESDFAGPVLDSLHVPAGTARMPIDIVINDDDDIEYPREIAVLSLKTPDSLTNYRLGHPSSAIVTIEEGVCDRTPQVRDGIVRQTGAAACADVQSADLASMIALRLSPGGQPPPPPEEDEDIWLPPALYDDPETRRPPAAAANSAAPEPLALRPKDFSGLDGLYYLTLNGFNLAELPAGILADLYALGVLRVEETQLTGFPWEELLNTPRLRVLELGGNRLSRMPSRALAHLSDLWALNLERNEFTEMREDAVAGLAGLERLYLSMNPLKSLPPRIFADLAGLRRLSLHRIEAEELPRDIFSPLSSLARLRLNYSPLRTVPSLAGLTNLEYLEINYNRLTDLPQDYLSGLERLVWLNLGGNERLRLRTGLFSGLHELRLLSLRAMEMSELPGSLVSGLAKLESLILSRNRISFLRPGQFNELSQLSYLDLSDNRIEVLPAGVFEGLARLRTLRLDGNPGTPFTLSLEAVRTDASDTYAPGPATVEVQLAEGAPFGMQVPLAVHGGDISADVVVLAPGTGRSTDVTVSADTAHQGGTQVVAGPAPRRPFTLQGIELRVGDPLILFDTVSNRAPIAERVMPTRRMQAGGPVSTIVASSYFRDPDGDELAYQATSGDPRVVATSVEGDRIELVPNDGGAATVTVTATDEGGLSAELSFQVIVVGGSPGSFDIHLILIDEVSAPVQEAFDFALAYWSAILAGTDLPDVVLEDDFELGCWDITTDELLNAVDDVVIVATVTPIDGRGRILAGAGPCGVREGTHLPFMGAMLFDAEDLEWLAESGDLEEVIAHEIGHVLGIGTIWESLDLLRNPSLPGNPGADTHFPGPLAIEAFDEAGGTEYTGIGKVPVENRAGRGSGDAHWRESVLGNELMTPYQDVGIVDPLSAITIQSLADLGYKVDVSIAEQFTLPGTTGADIVAPRRKIAYGEDILRGPIVVVDRRGRIVRVIPEPRR